jgi:hypothetical protein
MDVADLFVASIISNQPVLIAASIIMSASIGEENVLWMISLL